MESLQLQGRREDRSRGQEMRTSALPAAANGNGRTGGRGDGRQQAFARGSTAAAASSGGSNSFQHMLEAGGESLSDEVGKEQRDAGRRFVAFLCFACGVYWSSGVSFGVECFFGRRRHGVVCVMFD